VKLTGKYTPLRQWLHHDFFEVLPDTPVTRSLINSRYHDLHILFGDEFVEKAATSSSFLIGAGALGCEFIKMFALMGLSTKKGKVSVTDDDNIEISNLNRQFLFRRKHVGKNKSEVACKVGKHINNDATFDSIKLRVGAENESIFDDDFWNSLTFVVNAVDNVKARQYVDGQCVWFEKPLFESGTLGTKCHSQIILPHATISYTDIIDPPEESIPLCTLKNFPYQIEHTIQWARDYFEGTFSEPSSEISNFFEDRDGFLNTIKKQNRQNPTTLRIKL
jgi:ubiquitin-activating enzyme E1